jgi:hypothetical protein
MMPRLTRLWRAVLFALLLALPASTALAAQQTPTGAQRPLYVECAMTSETDNTQPTGSHNPFTDDLGNQWNVYYDLRRDSHDFAICQMRVVIRIINPPPDGGWKGTVDVFANVNGQYDSASYGKVGGSGTYQAHFVWRGPWFGADSGSYFIETDEFNGNNNYPRAWANFSL